MKILNSIRENMAVSKFKSIWESKDEVMILSNWGFARRMDHKIHHPQDSAHWNHPPVGGLTINFDRALKENLGPIKAMGVVHDHKGQILMLIIETLGIQISHFIKAWASFICIKMIESLYCNNFMRVGDLLNIIELLKGMVALGCEKRSMIKEARGILETMEYLSIHHNYREANIIVDKLANDVVALKDHRIWDFEFP